MTTIAKNSSVKGVKGKTVEPIPKLVPYGPEKLDRFKKVILAARKKAVGLLEDARLAIANNQIESSVEGAGGSETEIRTEATTGIGRYERQIHEYDIAIRLIESGRYGICEHCEPVHLIPEAELLALPGITMCVQARRRIRG